RVQPRSGEGHGRRSLARPPSRAGSARRDRRGRRRVAQGARRARSVLGAVERVRGPAPGGRMIRVVLAPEPESFDRDVRQPGLDAIRKLIGEAPLKARGGPKGKKIAASPAEIPSDKFPTFWRRALKDMLVAYGRLCAYSCLY